MSTWKKMAEAFGRAMKDPSASREGKDLVKKAVTIDDGMPDIIERLDRDIAYTKGRRDASAETSIEEMSKPPEERRRLFDERSDRRTDDNLKQNASDEWDEAFARRKQGVRDWYGKDYPQDMAEEGAEAFEKQLWDLVDELKAKGISAQDILNRIKGND